MTTDPTSPTGAAEPAAQDPRAAYFAQTDSVGQGGAPGMVLCTVAPGSRLTIGNGFDPVVGYRWPDGPALKKWVQAFEVRDLRNEGVIL